MIGTPAPSTTDNRSGPPRPSAFDRLRIAWAASRYDLFLDLRSVPGRHRRELRRELRSNLAEAAAHVGTRQALDNVGSMRALARESAVEGRLRSRWLAGWVAGLSTLAGLFLTFLLLSIYYIEGVLDSGTTEPVTSWLFPFFGSEVTVDPAGGLAFQVQTGPLPFVAALLVWLAVARPWRSVTERLASRSAGEA